MSETKEEFKPIQTYYDGYLFRSRKEARWAVFLDYIGVKYEYEQEGYTNGSGLNYLPDFYIPSANSYIEVKGFMTEEDERKITELSKANNCRIYVFGNLPKSDTWEVLLDDIQQEHDNSATNGLMGSFSFVDKGRKADFAVFMVAHNNGGARFTSIDMANVHIDEIDISKTLKAYYQARTARFEYGETPTDNEQAAEKTKEDWRIWLDELGIKVDNPGSHNTKLNQIGGESTVKQIYELCGHDKAVFQSVFKEIMNIYPNDPDRFDSRIIKEIGSFVNDHYGEYDSEMLASHIRKKPRANKSTSLHEFINEIKQYDYGRATFDRYNSCLRLGKGRLTNKHKANPVNDCNNESKQPICNDISENKVILIPNNGNATKITVNMTKDNYDFIQGICSISGQSSDGFINHIVTEYENDNLDSIR